MKKFVIFITCLLCASLSYAQQNLFQWSNPQINSWTESFSLQKPWQAALFLGTELRPTDETLQTLQTQIEQGHLKLATVISFSSEKQAQTNTARLYILSEHLGQVIRTERTFPPNTPTAVLVEALLAPLQANANLYTALLINGRGDGSLIKYAQDDILLISDITRRLSAHHLYVDVLDLQACHMGSAFTIKQLAQSGQIHYAIVSSELRRGSSQVMYYRLLNHFDTEPLQAALVAHEELTNVMDFSKDKKTHNSLVLNLSDLKIPFDKWHISCTNHISRGWHSFNDFLQEQNSPAARQLAQALTNATLSQWCFSAKTHTLYKDIIPPESGCINGININPQTLYNLTHY